MAQAVRHDEVEIESQAKEIPLLLQTVGQNNANGLKMMAGAPMAGAPMAGAKIAGAKMSGAYVRAGELKYDNPEGWKITPYYAVLIGSDELRVCGEYSTQKLGKKNCEVSFEVRLDDNCNINEVELTLTLPDGTAKKHKEGLENYPRNKRISLKVGKFFNSFESANIEFQLNGTECYIEKEGLVIFGVLIKADP